MGCLSAFAQALALLPVGRCVGLGQFAAMGFLGGPLQVGVNLLGVHDGGLLHAGEEGCVGEPPAAAQDYQAQEDGDHGDGESALPSLGPLPQLAQLIAQAQDDILQLGVVVRSVAEVILPRCDR